MPKKRMKVVDLAEELDRLENSAYVKLAMVYKEAEQVLRQKVDTYRELEEIGMELAEMGMTMDKIEELLGHPVF